MGRRGVGERVAGQCVDSGEWRLGSLSAVLRAI